MIDFVSLSNKQVLNGVTKESNYERRSTAYVVRYLAEIESRRLYLKLGFSSLFDFTTNKLGYSSSAAMRRIKAARLTCIDPTVAAKLENGELTFATIDLLSNFAKEPGLSALTQALCGRSREDAEKIVAHLRPLSSMALRDTVRPVVIAPNAIEAQPTLPPKSDQSNTCFQQNVQQGIRQCEEFGAKPNERFLVSFIMDREEKELLDRTRRLIFDGSIEEISFGRVIARTLKFYLVHHCPEERQRRRKERSTKRKSDTKNGRRQSHKPTKSSQSPTRNSATRYIPVAIRDQVLERDGYQCSFVSAEGKRCTSRADLEIDHILPVGRGGDSEVSNLRVLCRPHNLERAYENFGEEFVRKRIRSRRQKASGAQRDHLAEP